jgi:hypothetical protein
MVGGLAICGCAAPEGGPLPGSIPLAERLARAYPELASGRFVSIADFEDPRTILMCRLVNRSGSAHCVRVSSDGREETGGAAMRFQPGGPDDALRLEHAPDSGWYFNRDWRDFDVLLINVESPRDDLSLVTRITAGRADQERSIQTSTDLSTGWNTLRFDMRELGRHVPLDDIRALTFSIPYAGEPVAILVDDILVTRHRIPIFGRVDGPVGSLYVERVGRHWVAGAAGRVELALQRAQVVGLFHLESDPYRLRDLVWGAALGPHPTPCRESQGECRLADPLPHDAALAVRTAQRLLEASPTRLVIECVQEYLATGESSPASGSDTAPAGRLTNRYTIYRGGRIIIHTEWQTENASADVGGEGPVATALTLRGAWAVETLRLEESPGGGASDRRAEAQSQPDGLEARSQSPTGVLVHLAPTRAGGSTHVWGEIDEASDRVRLAVRPVAQGGTDGGTADLILVVGSTTGADVIAARADVRSYVQPPPCAVDVGSAVVSTPHVAGEAGAADSIPMGYDPSSGCYRFRHERGYLRFRWPAEAAPSERARRDERERPPATSHTGFGPSFEVLDTEGHQAAVYVNNFLVEEVSPTADGGIIFLLPTQATAPIQVEVVLRSDPGTSAGQPQP